MSKILCLCYLCLSSLLWGQSIKTQIQEKIVKVKIFATETKQGKTISLYGYLYNDKDRVWKIRQNYAEQTLVYYLPIGNYHLSVEYASLMKDLDFEINSKVTKNLHLIMGETGKVNIQFSDKKTSIPIYGYIYARKNHQKYGSCLEQIGERKFSTSNYRLPIGKYILIIYHGNYQKKLPFEINSKQKTNLFIDLDTFI